jgi:hypothetical protein
MTENLDRIKLPCYCTFEWRGKRRLGKLENDFLREFGTVNDRANIVLHEIDKQTHKNVGSKIDACACNPNLLGLGLEKLIKKYKINIGKAKIVYYETIGRKPMKQKHPQAKVDSACGEGK